MNSQSELILFADPLSTSDYAIALRESTKTGVQYRVADADIPLLQQLDGVTAIVTRAQNVNEEVITAATSLKYIMYEDFGTAQIDAVAAASRGIAVINLVNLGWLGVSEHALLLMLALVKQLPEAHVRTAAGERKAGVSEVKTTAREYTFSWLGQENLGWLYRKRLGLVGAGRIARGVAARARGFGMQIRYFAPHQLSADLESQLQMEYSPLDSLLEWADFVSLHARLTPQSAGLMGEAEFDRMQPHAYFINTARGALVDERALIDVLSEQRIAGAGLDVFEYEPTKLDNPLHTLDNVILTPHSAGIFNDDARVAQLVEAFDRVAQDDTRDYLQV